MTLVTADGLSFGDIESMEKPPESAIASTRLAAIGLAEPRNDVSAQCPKPKKQNSW